MEIDSGEKKVKIGGYEIVSTVSKGSTGVIYKGYDSILNRVVAVKVLSKDFLDDMDAIRRFEREAKSLAKVQHKNISLIYGVGKTEEGLYYLVMELIDGPTFADLIKNKFEFPYSRWCDFFIQVCEGLKSAYSQNVIHRDLRPKKIMLNRDEVVKIVGFCIAKTSREVGSRTMQEMPIEKCRYMSPEQGIDRNIDYRSDIYSLGATFYHILAGQPPYDADTPVALMMKHNSAPLLSIYLINPKVPNDICSVVHKMLSKNPDDRHKNYDELIEDLKSAKMSILAKERREQELYQDEKKLRESSSANGDLSPEVNYADDLSSRELSTSSISTSSESPERPLRSESGVGIENPTPPSVSSESKPSSDYEPGFGGYFLRDTSAPRLPKTPPPIKDIKGKPASTGQFFIIVILLLLLIFASFIFILSKLHSTDKSNRGFFFGILDKIFSTGENKFLNKKENPQRIAIDKTKDNIQIVSAAIMEYEIRKGSFPANLDDLISEGICRAEDLKDGWGRKLVFIEMEKKVLSFGNDGEEGTSDDFSFDKNGLHLPKAEILKEIEEKGF